MFNIWLKEGKFTCSSEQDLLEAARRFGVPIPVGCRSGGCGMCKIKVIEGDFERGTSSKAVLSDEDRDRNYSLACRTYPKSHLKIAIPI